MAYTSIDFETKKALKEAVAAGKTVTLYSPGLGVPASDGDEYVEGPHYPRPHKWYAKVLMQGGRVVKVV